ncbi:MAG TPA: dihydropteroate synthase [Nitrospinae bacterium]|nr:dihydropteroate synthase [Nitrospinota bacterium]
MGGVGFSSGGLEVRKTLTFLQSGREIPPEAVCRDRRIDFTRPRVMGIINATPDSFSDGGRFADPFAALDMIARMTEEGADIIDIGGESTRPGSGEVDEAEELRRVMPILERLDMTAGPLISIDTRKPAVARASLEAGVHIVNDIGAFADPGMRAAVAEAGAAAVLMHMKGEPGTMQEAPVYSDVVREVAGFLEERAGAAEQAGIGSVWVDPGIGFGKSWDHNLEILRALSCFTKLGRPLVVGVSKKTFIGKATGVERAADRLIGTKVAEAFAVMGGADVIRTHDVGEAIEGIKMAKALVRGTVAPENFREVR